MFGIKAENLYMNNVYVKLLKAEYYENYEFRLFAKLKQGIELSVNEMKKTTILIRQLL